MPVKGKVITTQSCAHPDGMRRPALAQAPAFRAPGGAAAHPHSSKPRERRPTAPGQAAQHPLHPDPHDEHPTAHAPHQTTAANPSTDTGYKQPRSERHQSRGAAKKQRS